MILNNEKVYNTPEKSARYTVMQTSDEEQVLYDKWIDLEAKIGFEDMAYRDEIANGRNISFYDHCPELVSLFFGDLSINSETDKKITDKMKEILQSLLDEIERNEQKWTS